MSTWVFLIWPEHNQEQGSFHVLYDGGQWEKGKDWYNGYG
jgi:hypothetical protein